MADPVYDQAAFDNKYKPNLSQSDFDTKYAPQGSVSSGIEMGGIDPMYALHQDYMSKGPFTGEASDHAFSQTGAGRIMQAFGQHAKAGWDGSGDSAYHAELDREAKEKDVGLFGAIRDAWMKPTSAAIDFATKAGYGLMGGIGGATGQLGEELGSTAKILEDSGKTGVSIDTPWQKINLDTGHILSAPLRYGEEVLKGVSAGALPDNPVHVGEAAFRTIDFQKQLSEARAKGYVGEGEPGYFGINKPTPEQMQERQSAAEDAGLGKDYHMVREDGSVLKIPGVPKEGEPVVPTTAELAREIDPDAFKEIERLSDEQENIRNSRDYLNAKVRQPGDIDYVYKDQKRIQEQIDELNAPTELADIDQRLRALSPAAKEAKGTVEELLNSDTPEGAQYRDYVQAKAFEAAMKAEDLRGPVNEALRRADELKKSTQPPPNKAKDVDTNGTNKSSGIDSGIAAAADEVSKTKRPEVIVDPEVTDTGSKLKAVKGTGKATPLSLNKRMELDNVIRGWKSEAGEVPESETVKNVQQFTDALEFIDENPSAAERVAMGDAEAPDHVYPEAVLRVLKNRAVEDGNYELGMRLAETKLGGEARTMGQRLQLLRGGYDIDPVGIIQDINDLLGEQAAKAVKDTVNNMKATVDKAMDTFKPAVDSFLKSIECDY